MSDQTSSGPVVAADGRPLKQSLQRALRRQKLRALMLIAPLLIFILVAFIAPIGAMLFRSVENEVVSKILPRTVVALENWDYGSGEAPDEPVFAALGEDLLEAVQTKSHTILARRLNYEKSGMTSLIKRTGRKVKRMDMDAPLRPQFIEADQRWADPEVWGVIKAYSSPITAGYFLNAMDLRLTPDGIEKRPESDSVYVLLFKRTILLSALITFMTFLLGYPIAYLLSNLRMKTANMLMILVLLPFWTSLLVRTSAWKVLLQQQGVINDVLVWLGLVADDNRLELINNATGTVIAMTHILLPFMILPLYSVMKTIPPSYVRAAKSLGATDFTAFRRVYFPQSVPGIGAGAILVFILAIGYYITPALVGGTSGTFISNRIAYNISVSGNWGLAAALGALLLILVMALYVLYDKIVGIDNVKLG